MIFAEMDTTPIWTTGGVTAVLTMLGIAGKWLFGWFRETIKSQHDHEKALADGFRNHEEKLSTKSMEHEKALAEKWSKHEENTLREMVEACDKFDLTVKELRQAQATESSQTITTLLALQKEMLTTMLGMRQQTDQLASQFTEMRRQVEVNGQEIKQVLRLFPEPKVDRVRKVPNQ